MPHTTVPPSKVSVRARVAGYIQVALAGVVLLVFPPNVTASIQWLVVSWIVAWFLIVSGTVASVYAARYKYRAEYVCSWGIITAVSVLSISLWFFVLINGRGSTVAFALLFGALACKYIARAGDLSRLMKNQKGAAD